MDQTQRAVHEPAYRSAQRSAHQSAKPTFSELFMPKLVTVWREGYTFADFKADAIAGLTVAIVALPLSMAIAIASGVTPERGLYTSIVGGFIISALGGSRFQIGGPAGAFIVLVAATVARVGIDGLLLATMMAGVFLLAIGYLRLGTYIKFIPYPVTVGFTAGIAVIIFSGQIVELFGLKLAGKEPGPLVPKLIAVGEAAGTINPAATFVAVLTVATIAGLKRWRPTWPAMLIAIGLASLVVALLALPAETIGTRFGGIPRSLQMPALPPISLDRMIDVLPDAIAFALLGAIESLLSAVVADGMTGRRHRSNCELVAQGFANIASALFGGICATGTIARTATNVRAGAHGPVSGIVHAAILLALMLVAAPLASYIPLAALAGVLAVVCWNMFEKQAFATLLRASRGDALVLMATFLLVIFRDLTEGIVVGFVLGSILFIDRMAKSIAVEADQPLVQGDVADSTNAYDASEATDADTVVYRISGAFFFGAASTVGTVLDRIADQRRNFILDCSAVPFFDSTAANVIEGAAHKAKRAGVRFIISGAAPQIRRMLITHGVKRPLVTYAASIKDARAQLKGKLEAG
ncbi:SulP family inorganic anion transporter [Mesorhizobium sp. M7A.F.Ca.CA.001.09.2.1]|uniref:SulP family inorganic anion transporter n=2 Tax=Phyllobacteriaceae TaxID=69277 RepID=A0AB38TCQ9_9HYPH|nr:MULTISPECIES: SulP family inorganic anion transporter [Mesorhizobium]RUY37379.1 SulP family inorganic anion transporter [Mesorhizobium sp. M7A.F.Ca.CA.001.13.2.1]MDF3213233.1 SulP family inorganic anion transporter [Mesorhizobium ciceri]RUY72242.1 SulP family inorganic anion transporter [Mesorhizobium sp. M7A.F.Ca.CA.001.13.1.1]RUY73809.1 SulP family inorganic anion transporter [Mesorhizobium sp. M7A.F.Ca.CA.001.05.1.1]RUY80501.1 SulP family inorganic anion transporter [Mesorhizobium sp. M7